MFSQQPPAANAGGYVSPLEEAAKAPEGELREFGKLLGVAPFGVCAFSNGTQQHFSGETSIAPANRKGYELELGYKWTCVEFARRFVAMSRGAWIRNVPVAEQLWKENSVIDIRTGQQHPLRSIPNNGHEKPEVGDLLVWKKSHTIPYGHIACITEVGKDWIRIAEQNHSFVSWRGNNYSRQLPLARKEKEKAVGAMVAGATGVRTTPPPEEDSTKYEITDASNSILGWMRVECDFINFKFDDIPDIFRHIVSNGKLERITCGRDTSLGWLEPSKLPTDFFLARSLIGQENFGKKIVDEDGEEQDAEAPEDAVPDGYYLFDYDIWMRVRTAAMDLHQCCMNVTHDIVSLPEEQRTIVLRDHFGFPVELAPLLLKSLQDTAPLGGRFDLGTDDQGRLKMLEYNSDSSAALLECADTQDKWAKYYGMDDVGQSTGSFLNQRIFNYWVALLNSPRCPKDKLVHFMIDDDDEERYTALTVMNAAKAAGLQCKLCIKLSDFRFQEVPGEEQPAIVDLEGCSVTFVWKTWSWDTILTDYHKQQKLKNDAEEMGEAAPQRASSPASEGSGAEGELPASSRKKRPALSDIMLHPNVRVLEPIWKCIAGSKAILPYLWAAYPGHPNLLPSAFEPVDEITKTEYLSKPVHGRAGQNITFHDAKKCKTDQQSDGEEKKCSAAFELENDHEENASFAKGSGIGCSFEESVDKILSMSPHLPAKMCTASSQEPNTPTSNNSFSGGRFADDLMVYQERIHLRKFQKMGANPKTYYPIVCAWMIEADFGGIVVREDTSRITKLGSIVAPARVVRK